MFFELPIYTREGIKINKILNTDNVFTIEPSDNVNVEEITYETIKIKMFNEVEFTALIGYNTFKAAFPLKLPLFVTTTPPAE